LGDVAKFAPPTVANGRVYVSTASNQLVVYGLTTANAENAPLFAAAGGAAPPPPPPPGAAAKASSDAGVASMTFTKLYASTIGPNTPGHCGNSGCHVKKRGGLKCGATKDDCFQGLVAAGLVDTAQPAQSSLTNP